MIFERYDTDLETDISEHRMKRKRYSEDELWNIADSCVAALAYLQEKNISYNMVDATRILLSVDRYKLNPIQSMIDSLKENPKRDKTRQFKADTYNLGITLLYASKCGNPHSIIEENLKEASKSYSTEWINFLRDLTNPDYLKRVDCATL